MMRIERTIFHCAPGVEGMDHHDEDSTLASFGESKLELLNSTAKTTIHPPKAFVTNPEVMVMRPLPLLFDIDTNKHITRTITCS